MTTLSRTWKLGIVVVVLGITLFAAETVLNTKGTEPAVAAPTSVSNRPTSFETDPIAGSDASISTYGLDPERIIDW
jgi:hypothetical protein